MENTLDMAIYSPDSVDKLARLANDLSRHGNWCVRQSVAENTSAPGDALNKLATDKYSEVRLVVAGNTGTPGDALNKLATDKYSEVRLVVAENPSAPGEVLEKSANDKNKDVRNAVKLNPSTPEHVKVFLALEPAK